MSRPKLALCVFALKSWYRLFHKSFDDKLFYGANSTDFQRGRIGNRREGSFGLLQIRALSLHCFNHRLNMACSTQNARNMVVAQMTGVRLKRSVTRAAPNQKSGPNRLLCPALSQPGKGGQTPASKRIVRKSEL